MTTIVDPPEGHHTRIAGRRFAQIPEELLYDADLSHLAVRVYGALIRHGEDPGSCYPSHARLGDLLGVAARSMRRPLRELEAAGWIERFPRYLDDGGRTSDGYLVNTERRADTRAPRAETRGTPRAETRGAPARRRAVKESKENESKLNENTRDPRDDARTVPASLLPEEDDRWTRPLRAGERLPEFEFADWWKLWPRRVARARAEKEYAAARRKASGAVLAEAAAAYAGLVKRERREDRHIAHASTWLHGERWNDEVLPASAVRPESGWDRSGPSGAVDPGDL